MKTSFCALVRTEVALQAHHRLAILLCFALQLTHQRFLIIAGFLHLSRTEQTAQRRARRRRLLTNSNRFGFNTSMLFCPKKGDNN